MPPQWLASQPQIADEARCGEGTGKGKGVRELEKKKESKKTKGKSERCESKTGQRERKSIHREFNTKITTALYFET